MNTWGNVSNIKLTSQNVASPGSITLRHNTIAFESQFWCSNLISILMSESHFITRFCGSSVKKMSKSWRDELCLMWLELVKILNKALWVMLADWQKAGNSTARTDISINLLLRLKLGQCWKNTQFILNRPCFATRKAPCQLISPIWTLNLIKK